MSLTSSEIEQLEREAIAGRQAALRVLTGAVTCVFVVAAIAIYLGVRSGLAVESLCKQQVAARIELARIKEARADRIVPGPDYLERRALVLAEANGLRQTAAAARCEERYRLP